MKKLLVIVLALGSFSAFAEKMGSEAIEVFKLMSNSQVKHCLKDVSLANSVNVKIDKLVEECPGCNTYTIELLQSSIDIISLKKTVTLTGKLVPGIFNKWFQGYDCKVKVEEL